MSWLRRARIPALVLAFAAAGSVLIAASIDRWISDQARYDAFRSASACTQWPLQADNACVALQPARVLGVQNIKGETDVWVQGWPDLDYNDPVFVYGLHTGQSVEVIVWHGAAQGLETASQGPDYADDSAVLAPTTDFAMMVAGVAALCVGALCGAVAVLRRRGASRERIRTVRWAFGAASGLAVVNVLGVALSVSLTGGFIADGVVGALGLIVISLIWAYLGWAPARAPARVRPAGLAIGPCANARKRRGPRSRPRRRRPGPR